MFPEPQAPTLEGVARTCFEGPRFVPNGYPKAADLPSRSALRWFRPELPLNLCIFGKKTRSIVVHYREICELSAKKPDQLSVIVSLTPLFSYT